MVPARARPWRGRCSPPGRKGPRLTLDLTDGTVALDGEPPRPLSRVVLSGDAGAEARTCPAPGPEFHLFVPGRLGVLVDPVTAVSVFDKAYVLHASASEHFRRVHAGSRFQIWRVSGDGPAPGGDSR